jgi:hypothetical protein
VPFRFRRSIRIAPGVRLGLRRDASHHRVRHPLIRLSRCIDRMSRRLRRGRAARAELITGIEGVSSRPVRRIVLREKNCT